MEPTESKDWSSPNKNVEEAGRIDCAQSNDEDEILEAIDRAAKYGFCLNRTWAVARSLQHGIFDLPKLLPQDDIKLENMFGQKDERKGYNRTENDLHEQCTFDFCEQSQVNFTSVAQRHESPYCTAEQHCTPLEGFFPRYALNEAVLEDRRTAWQLNGSAIIEPGQKYMAISHV